MKKCSRVQMCQTRHFSKEEGKEAEKEGERERERKGDSSRAGKEKETAKKGHNFL